MSFVSADVVWIYPGNNSLYKDGFVSDDGLGSVSRDNSSDYLAVGDDGSQWYRAFIDFNTSVIPDGSTINFINLSLTPGPPNSGGTGITFNVVGLNQTSVLFSDSQLLTACAGGAGSQSTYGSKNFNGLANGETRNVTLSAAAVQNLSAQLSRDFFSVCLYMPGDDTLPMFESDFHSNESTTVAYHPNLIVEYTPAAAPALNVTLVYPSANMNVPQNRFFNVTVNVSCYGGGSCGDVNVSLDPAPVPASDYLAYEAENVAPSGFFAKVWFYVVKFFIWTGNVITGHVTGGLVNTTIGATPFYTNMSNPANGTDFACLYGMSSGGSCIVYWTVNATNNTGEFEFYAFANSTSTSAASAVSRSINLTILEEDLISPQINYVDDHVLEFDSPDIQELGRNVTISASITDNQAVDEVIINVTGPSGQTSYSYIGSTVNKDGSFYYINYLASQFGVYNYTIWANDTSSNENETSGNFTIIDMWAPEIANITVGPQILAGAGSTEYLNVSVTDDHFLDSVWAEIEYPNGNKQNFSMANLTSSPVYELQFIAPALRGKYTVVFYANDSYGNVVDTSSYPYNFYVPPYLGTDRKIYSLGQTVKVIGVGFSAPGLSVDLDLKNSTGSSMIYFPNSTLADGAQKLTYNWTVPYDSREGNYTLSAYDSGYGATVYSTFEIREYYKGYPEGTIIIPMDTKQSTNVNDFDFLRAYGLVWRLLNASVKVDWIITPPCVEMNATVIGSGQRYVEQYCNGFFLIDNASNWNVINAYRSLPDFSGIVIHNLSSEARVRQTQITQMVKQPRIALWYKGEEIVDQTLNESRIPYKLLDLNSILSGALNSETYDIFMIGHYDFLEYVNKTSPANYTGLIANITAFLERGDMHAECVGVDSLDKGGGFIGNVLRGPSESGSIRIVGPTHQITQTHALTTANSGGLTPTLRINNAPAEVLIHAVDNNWAWSNFVHQVGRSEVVKFISKETGSGYITYAGGHLGQVRYDCSCGEDCTSCWRTTSYAVPRNRMINNLVFFGGYVNDQTPPSIDPMTMVPTPGANVTQFRSIGLATSVSDNVLTSTLQVWGRVAFNTSEQTLLMNGPYYPLNYTIIFSNTSYVVDKSTSTRYNVTFYANDTDGNVANSTTWFFVIPDQIPQWRENNSIAAVSYNSSKPSVFNITWGDDFAVNVSSVIFESNFSGMVLNYSMNQISGTAANGSYNFSGVMPAGNYYWKSYTQDEYNQWNESDKFYFTISQALSEVNLTLNSLDDNITAEAGDSVTITGLLSGLSGNVSVYDNGVLVGIGSGGSITNMTNYWTVGLHNITVVFGGDQNYSGSSETHFIEVQDTIIPFISLVNPTPIGGALISDDSFAVNVSASDLNLSNVTVYLFNSTGLVNSTTIPSGQPYFVNFTNLPDGVYYINSTAIDFSGNSNSTETRTIIIDTIPPQVTINGPNSTIYSSSTILINITLNEAGYCVYTLNNGLSNWTLTNLSAIEFTQSLTLTNGNYQMYAYCNDSAGNRNDSVYVNFTINYYSGGGGGGGGGECTITSWTCGEWTDCSDNEKERSCTSNCDTQKIENEACNVSCTNECMESATYCSGSNVMTCEFVDGCYKLSVSNLCTENESCSDGQCITKPIIEEEQPQKLEPVSDIPSIVSHAIPLIRPSHYFPHSGFPPAAFDGVVVAAAAGVTWIIWAWIIGLLVPFFWIRLRHYCISIFDAQNRLKMFKESHLDKERTSKFLGLLEKRAGKIIFAERNDGVLKYFIGKGFLEIRTDKPFIMSAHFTRWWHAYQFKKALRETLDELVGKAESKKINISEVVEKASLFGAWRAYRRKKKMEAQIRRMFRK